MVVVASLIDSQLELKLSPSRLFLDTPHSMPNEHVSSRLDFHLLPRELWQAILELTPSGDLSPLRQLASVFWEAALNTRYRNLDIVLDYAKDSPASNALIVLTGRDLLTRRLQFFSEPFISKRVRSVRVQPGLGYTSEFQQNRQLSDAIQLIVARLTNVEDIMIGSVQDNANNGPSPYMTKLLAQSAPRLVLLAFSLQDETIESSHLRATELGNIHVSFPELKCFKVWYHSDTLDLWRPVLQRMLLDSSKLQRLDIYSPCSGGFSGSNIKLVPLSSVLGYPALTTLRIPRVQRESYDDDLVRLLQTHGLQIQNLTFASWVPSRLINLLQPSILQRLHIYMRTGLDYSLLMEILEGSQTLRELSVKTGGLVINPKESSSSLHIAHMPFLERLYIFSFSYNLRDIYRVSEQFPRLRAFTLHSDYNFWCGSTELRKYTWGSSEEFREKESGPFVSALLEIEPLFSTWNLDM
ncbi:hypothetical protein DL96DRAFT_1811729, partial [Flagelloscypha sp. PMI_526]